LQGKVAALIIRGGRSVC